MPELKEEIAHLREKAAQFVALAKQHGEAGTGPGYRRIRLKLMEMWLRPI
jgi:hypothetical protein